MTVHVPRIHTVGEKALIAAIEAARPMLPGNATIGAKRDAALALLRAEGLPTRKIEEWHYTDFRSLFRSLPEAGKIEGANPVVKNASVAATDDQGVVHLSQLEGVSIASMAPAFASGAADHLLRIANAADAVGLVSTALASTGFDINVANGVETSAPIQMDFAAQSALHAVNRVSIGTGAKATIIERAHGGGFSSIITDLTVADNAEATFVVLQEVADDASHLARLTINIGKKAKVMLVVINTGAGLARREIDVTLNGEHTDFRIRGMNLLSGSRFNDVTMVVRHIVENTSSTEFFRNVVTGAGRGVFQGQIRVAAEAQKTDAKMACNTLLLSDEGEFLAKPELEIFADDVACGHGATVSEINEDHLFYLMARGIPADQSRALLVKAFVSELVDEIEDEALHDALLERLAKWLATH
ncbi:MAG: Fe-S cluster assembly protein SufD [Notoacmeibacter sp.]